MAKIGMGDTVFRMSRYEISLTDIFRVIVIAFLVTACTLIAAIPFPASLALISYPLFFIPVLYATYFYGRGGIIVAGICGMAYLTAGLFLRQPDPAALAGITLEAILLVVIAGLLAYFIGRAGTEKARYRSVFGHPRIGIVTTILPDFRIEETNDTFAGMLQYSAGEMTGMTFPSLAFTDGEKMQLLERVEQHDEGKNFEVRFRTKDGGSCRADLSWSAIDGRTASFTVIDINPRNLIEEIDSEPLVKYRQLMENSPAGILVLQEGRIRYTNPAFGTFSEYSPQELTGKDPLSLLDARDRETFGKFKEHPAGGTRLPEGTEFRFMTKSGSGKAAMVFISTITHNNQQITLLNLVDISVQQRLEEKIRQDTERRRGIIITVAHELRTPLQPILGYLNLMVQDPEGFGIRPETKKMLSRCLVSVERERRIINQMLELSVLDSGKIRLSFSKFSLSALVRSVLDTCGYLSKGDVTVDIPADLIIAADRDRLYSVLDAILSNAVNYSKPPRKIHIAYRPGAGGTTHTISIQDNGIGISEDMFASIFEPFELADASVLSRKYDRLGLSLSIARQIIRMHGGEITLESTENVGSTFTIHIPRELPEEMPHVG
jgi:PAS domain S-box-containing protein